MPSTEIGYAGASTGVSYQMGDEKLDDVCTSLDGPRCDPDEKAKYLAQVRVEDGGMKERAETARGKRWTLRRMCCVGSSCRCVPLSRLHLPERVRLDVRC